MPVMEARRRSGGAARSPKRVGECARVKVDRVKARVEMNGGMRMENY